MIREATKKATNQFEATNAQTKAIEVRVDTAKAQANIAKA